MRVILYFLVWIAAAVFPVFARADLPRLDDLLPQIVARAKTAETNSYQKIFAYEKKTVTDEYDSRGSVSHHKEDLSAHLPAAARERRKKRLITIDETVVEKFNFSLIDREEVQDRTALLLEFHPNKAHHSSESFQDQLARKVSGRIWVDEADLEIVRIEAHLDAPVRLMGGIVAALEQFSYLLERQRLPAGDWVPRRVETQVKGRKFLTEIHRHKEEFWENFRR